MKQQEREDKRATDARCGTKREGGKKKEEAVGVERSGRGKKKRKREVGGGKGSARGVRERAG